MSKILAFCHHTDIASSPPPVKSDPKEEVEYSTSQPEPDDDSKEEEFKISITESVIEYIINVLINIEFLQSLYFLIRFLDQFCPTLHV